MSITLGPKIPAIGIVTVLPARSAKYAHELPAQLLDDVVRDLAALIVSLVDDRALLVLLREVVAVERRVTGARGVRQPHVGELAAGKLVHEMAIVVDPCLRAQLIVVADRLHGDDPRSLRGRRAVHAHGRQLARSALEEAVEILWRAHRTAVHIEDVVTLRDLDPRHAERRVQIRIPAARVV